MPSSFLSRLLLITLQTATIGISIPSVFAQQQSEVATEKRWLAFRINIDDLKRDPVFGFMNWELIGTKTLGVLGFDGTKIKEAGGFLELRQPDDNAIGVEFIPLTPFSIAELSANYYGDIQPVDSRSGYLQRPLENSAFLVIQNENKFYFGSKPAVFSLLDEDRILNGVEARLKASKSLFHITIDLRVVRSFLFEFFSALQEDATDDYYLEITELVTSIDYIDVFSASNPKQTISISFEPRPGVSVSSLEQKVRRSLNRCTDYLQKSISSNPLPWTLSRRELFAWDLYIDRLKEQLNNLPITSNQRSIELDIPQTVAIPLVSLALPIGFDRIQSTSLSGSRNRAMDQMWNIGSAWTKHAEENEFLLPRTIQSESGKDLLSWRVALLPYLGYRDLYKRFRLDEPWDSDHNRQLIEQIPPVYITPRYKLPLGQTVYLAPFGGDSLASQTVWDLRSAKLIDIKDSPENTILVIETLPSTAVPWTAPSDIDISVEDLRNHLESPPNASNLLFLDKSRRWISSSAELSNIKALLSCCGGETITSR